LKIVLIGYGSIGQAHTPMLRRHFPASMSVAVGMLNAVRISY